MTTLALSIPTPGLACSLLMESLGMADTAVSPTALALGPQGGRAIPEGQGARTVIWGAVSMLPAF